VTSGTDQSPERFPSTIGAKALDVERLRALLVESGEPAFRAKQVIRWLYGRRAHSWDEMTDLPAALRESLSQRLALPCPETIRRQVSEDGTRKYLFRLGDGTTVEAVGLPTADRLTVCFSTQAGCAMGCSFCATGASGFTRDLGPGEMVDQVTTIAEDFGHRVTNAVAMGQGEPFANYDATLAALRIMNSADGPGIGARHLTVSTCGLTPGIRRFASEPEQFTLAVSLHSAVQSTRDTLMPGVRAMPLQQLRAELESYIARTGRRPSLEYALVLGVNDTGAELSALIDFCRGMLVHVNLIPVNPVDGLGHERTTLARANEFADALRRNGTEASIRSERGADIDAACGQLRQREAAD
jgi:23S rRNA (adenine2503-C2)-methyltransferase